MSNKGWRHCSNCSIDSFDITYQEEMPLCGEEWEEYERLFGLDDIQHYENLLCYRCWEENTWVWPKSNGPVPKRIKETP